MNNELHKRLLEAAKKYEPNALYPDDIIPCREQFIVNGKRLAFYAGAEHGYKEAIAQAKKWLEKHIPCIHTHEGDSIYVHGFRHIPMARFLADFEADMNKLLEEQK